MLLMAATTFSRLIQSEVDQRVDQVTRKPATKPANRLWNVQSNTTSHDNVSWNDADINCMRTQATPTPTSEPNALEIIPRRAPSCTKRTRKSLRCIPIARAMPISDFRSSASMTKIFITNRMPEKITNEPKIRNSMEKFSPASSVASIIRSLMGDTFSPVESKSAWKSAQSSISARAISNTVGLIKPGPTMIIMLREPLFPPARTSASEMDTRPNVMSANEGCPGGEGRLRVASSTINRSPSHWPRIAGK